MKNLETNKFYNLDHFKKLISVEDRAELENNAQLAHYLTVLNFGKTLTLYTPLYLSNYCTNGCLYCGFNKIISLKRQKLSKKEIKEEGLKIYQKGIRNILLVSGEDDINSDVEYFNTAILTLKKMFSSVAIEVKAMSLNEYKALKKNGLDCVTIYQETYSREIYKKVHPFGAKADYDFRYTSAERICEAGIRSLNLGILLGLNKWENDAVNLAEHLLYLSGKYPDTEFSVSFPRIRKNNANFNSLYDVSDIDLVKIIISFRLFMPKLGIAISTRENEDFRNSIIPLGVTKMSIGSKTHVGKDEGHEQFSISDKRDVDVFRSYLQDKAGYNPVFQAWN